jgi:hypothetical protein
MLSREACSGKREIWVDGSTLRRFFSCEDDMDDILHSVDKNILQHNKLRCKHGIGLHPRVACEGKLLTKRQFDAYIDLLRSEREEILSHHHLTTDMPVCDTVLNRDTDLFCDTCARQYKEDLSSKLINFKKLILLYDNLDPNNDQENLTTANVSYALSKAFSTNCRKFIAERLKKIFLSSSTPVSSSHLIDQFNFMNLVQLSFFDGDDISNKTNDKHWLDPKVNSKIVCK